MEIRPVEAADLPAMQDFSNRFNRPGCTTFKRDFFRWQFAAAAVAAGQPDLCGIAAAFESDGRVLGYCASHLQKMAWNGGEILGSWLHEWFVDPEASGIGFRLLTEVTKNSMFVGVSGGSVNTMNVFLRLAPSVAWFELTRVVAILDAAACSRLLAPDADQRSASILKALSPRVGDQDDAELTLLDRFGEETRTLWTEVARSYLLASDHSADTLNWRYADHPVFDYRRALVTSAAGSALMVWRIEPVQNVTEPCTVARLCEAIGSEAAIMAAVPTLLRQIAKEGAILCDFFGSHSRTIDALVSGGMVPSVTTPYLDVPRLFSPLQSDMRRTINFACFIRGSDPREFKRPHSFYLTKGDSSQDRPNP